VRHFLSVPEDEEPREGTLMGAHEVHRLVREGGEILDDLTGAPGIAAAARLPQIVAVFDVSFALHDLHAAREANLLPSPILQAVRHFAHWSPLSPTPVAIQ
jgi:hypothetical protein